MLYEILKTSKLGASFAPDMYTALWAQKLARDGEVKTLSGIPPLTFPSNGQPLLDYLISSNTVQSGTPTPDNPIMPQGTGERTANLLNPSSTAINIQGVERYGDVFRAGTYCIINNSAYDLFWRDGVSSTSGRTIRANASEIITTSNELVVWHTNYSTDIMVAEVDVIIPYEPYGYKISILNNSQTTNVYLGEVQTTRKIKKLVLTGEERDWQFYQQTSPDWQYEVYQFWFDNIVDSIQNSSLYSTIAPFGVTAQSRQNYEYGCYTVSSGKGIAFQMVGAKDTFTNITAWKSYLATQYAAGTPVTVWYILATPETTVVNEPLMRIGDYADTVSYEQAGVQIPTARGTNTLDVLTNVKPSEIYIQYKS